MKSGKVRALHADLGNLMRFRTVALMALFTALTGAPSRGQVLPLLIVDAGPDQVVTWPEARVSLTGDVQPLSGRTTYFWTAVPEREAIIAKPSDLKTEVSFSNVGDYLLILTANEGLLGGDVSDTCRITVQIAPSIGIQPQSQSVLAPYGTNFSVVTNGGYPAPTYRWQRAAPGSSSWANLIGNGALTPTYTLASTTGADNGAQFRCLVSNTVGTVTSSTAVLTVQYAPIISAQPVSVGVVAPAQALFNVTASGNPSTLTYQWRRNGVDIPGATNHSYAIPTTSYLDNNTFYNVWIGNAAGGATSANAYLTVYYRPRITAQPSPVSVTAPATANFSVVAEGNPNTLTYTWLKTQNSTTLTYPGTANFSINPTSTADNGALIRVVVSNAYGSDTSQPALLSVNAAAASPAFLENPRPITVTSPQAATFSITVSGNPTPALQWQRGAGSPAVWNDISGATAATYALNPTSPGDTGAQFRCVATNGMGAAISTPALLTVNYAPILTLQPVSATVLAPATGRFTVAASGNPAPTYQWQRLLNGVWTAIPSSTLPSHVTAATSASDHGAQFRCQITNTAGQVISAVATLYVQFPAAITVQPVNRTVADGSATSFSVTATGNPAPTYQWYRNTDVLISGAVQATYTTGILSMPDSGSTFRVVVQNGIGSPVSSTPALLSVTRVRPVITTEPANALVSENQPVSFSVVATGSSPLSYQWRRNGSAISGANGTAYGFSAVALSDSGAVFSCIVSNPAGADTSLGALLRVNRIPPTITNTNLTANVTLGNAFNYTIATTGSAPITFGATPLPAGVLFNASTGILSGTPTAAGTTNVTLSAVNPAGSAPTKVLVINVSAQQFAPSITSALTATGTVGQPFTYTLTATGTQPITLGANNPPPGTTFAGAVISGTPTTAGSFQTTLTAQNGVSTDTRVLNTTINPASVAPAITSDLPPSLTVTERGRATFTVTATGVPAPSYQWQYLNAQNAVSAVGGNSPTYIIDSASLGAAGRYRVIASNGVLPADTSAICSLTVNAAAVAPQITAQPASRTVNFGQPVTFTAQASGTAPLSYQWQKVTANISGATASSYTIAAVTVADSGRYRLVATNAAGSAISAYATLTVNIPKVDRPRATPTGTSFYPSVTVSLVTDTVADTIRYTVNGADPVSTSPIYTQPVSIAATTTLKARAYKGPSLAPSDLMTETYSYTAPGKAARPFVSPPDSVFTGSITLTLTTSTLPPESTFIYYTAIPGVSTPTRYTAPVTLFQTTAFRAWTVKAGLLNSDTLVMNYRLNLAPSKVAKPSATPSSTRFRGALPVALSCATDSAAIWYTTDNSDPAVSATRIRYTAGSLSLTQTTMLAAVALRTGWTASDLLNEGYTLAPGPVQSNPPVDTNFQNSLTISLSVPGNDTLYYTLDGTVPVDAQFQKTNQAVRYAAPFQIFGSATVVAVAVRAGIPSDTLTRFYTLSLPGSELPRPSATPSSRTFPDTLMVALRGSDSSVAIRYTLNGTVPNQASPLYQGPIRLEATTEIQAIATKTGYLQSQVLRQNYVLSPDTPSATPRGGRFFGAVTVSLNSSARQAQIFYTLDGSTPVSGTATPYSGSPIRLTQSATLKAIAVAGNIASPIRSEVYDISPTADTVLTPGMSVVPGGGISFYHPGTSPFSARVTLAPPETVVVNGFRDIPYGILLGPAVPGEAMPSLVFSRPPSDTRSLYRIGADGRTYFVSDASTVTLTEAGIYFLGLDTLPPVVVFAGESFDALDSTRVRIFIDDNVANLLYNLQRSDDPSRNISQLSFIAPDTLAVSLKNPGGPLSPLSLSITVTDRRNTARYPAGPDPRLLGQRLAASRSPPRFHIGENTAAPWDMVAFPFEPLTPVPFSRIDSANPTATLRFAIFNPGTRRYDTLRLTDTLVPGAGYWIGSTQAMTTLDLPGMAVKPPSDTVRIRVRGGWNMVGNPTPRTLHWPVNRRDRVQYRFESVKAPWANDAVNGDYAESDSLEPWTGYFVFSNSPDTVLRLLTRVAPAPKAPASPFWTGNNLRLELKFGKRTLELGSASGASWGTGIEDEPALPSLTPRPALVSLRQGGGLRADYIPARSDTVAIWKILASNPGTNAAGELRLASLSLPGNFQAWIVSPARGLKMELRPESRGFLPAPGADTLLVVAGTPDILSKSGLLDGMREGVPGFGMRLLAHGEGFTMELDLPSETRVEARLVNLQGRTVGTFSPRRLGAGHHKFTFTANFRKSSILSPGIYLLQTRHQAAGIPAQSVKPILWRN